MGCPGWGVGYELDFWNSRVSLLSVLVFIFLAKRGRAVRWTGYASTKNIEVPCSVR